MMKKNHLIAVALAATMGASALTGCQLVTTDSRKDMQQVVAEVNITKSESFVEGGEYAAYADVIDTYEVVKRDLVAYFVNVGYVYVQSYGYTYEQTFELIMKSIVNQQIIAQYGKVYFLELAKGNAEEYPYSVDAYLAAVTAAPEDEKAIASYRYFLTEDEYNAAVYSLNETINDALDSYEKNIVASDDSSESTSTTSRTLPTGANTTKEDYYDPDYDIYTGKNAASSCGTYETVEGSTPSTRKKAYNRFLRSLESNYLYGEEEQGMELKDLAYYKSELESQLCSAFISKLADTIEDEAAKTFTEEYVTARYNELLAGQMKSLDDPDAFETAIDSLSDSSFVLYAPQGGYGFVINILLPFSSTQKYQLSGYQSDGNLTQDELYAKRAGLLRNLKATDQRSSWFTGSEDYSFVSADAFGGEYVFFEDALSGEGKNEKLTKYYGKYAFNGTVVKDEDEKYTITPNKITIDEFIDIFEGYVSFATGLTPVTVKAVEPDYYAKSYMKADGSVDYSSFLYYAGKFDVNFNANELFVEGTASYNAFSAVNELSFAYNTDTAGLNGYLGYAVSAFNTSYVKEFEFAAKYAVAQGVGGYTVAPSDYGWHVMYCTYTFDEGEIYTFNYADIEKEGTFSYYFYEALKSSTAGNATNSWETKIINTYHNDTCIVDYTARYDDLKKLGV